MSEYIPNSFQVPNHIIDEIAGSISAKAFACLIFIIRKTRGWHKPTDSIPMTQFKTFLGLKDDRTVQKILSELELLQLIIVQREVGKMNEYSLGEAFNSAQKPPTKNAGALNAGTHKKCSEPPTKNAGGTTHKKCGSSKDTTKNTIQKENNIKEKKPFAIFWDLYPKRVAKDPAEKSCNRLSAKEQTEVLEKLPVQYRHTQKQFIPNPSTYLNQKRWQDEIIQPGNSHETSQRNNQHESNHARVCRETREAIEASAQQFGH